MTLISIITQALIVLNRTTDAQSMEAWKDKFTMFANDGCADIAEYMNLKKSEEVEITDGVLHADQLTEDCQKIISVKQNGSDVSFTLGDMTGDVKIGTSGKVTVEYRYLPAPMSNDIDEPAIPKQLHPLLVPYIAHCEHMTADPTTQRRSDAFYQKYLQGLKQAKRNLGEEDTYKITGVQWV